MLFKYLLAPRDHHCFHRIMKSLALEFAFMNSNLNLPNSYSNLTHFFLRKSFADFYEKEVRLT
jgi:hypothetical protein